MNSIIPLTKGLPGQSHSESALTKLSVSNNVLAPSSTKTQMLGGYPGRCSIDAMASTASDSSNRIEVSGADIHQSSTSSSRYQVIFNTDKYTGSVEGYGPAPLRAQRMPVGGCWRTTPSR